MNINKLSWAEAIGTVLGGMLFYIVATGIVLWGTYNAFAPNNWPSMSIWVAFGITIVFRALNAKENNNG